MKLKIASSLAMKRVPIHTPCAPNASAATTIAIVATNAAGPSAAPGATVADAFSPDLTGCSWTCVGAGGATCAASGAGDINDTASLPVGGSATYTATCMVDPGATGSLVNTATVTAFMPVVGALALAFGLRHLGHQEPHPRALGIAGVGRLDRLLRALEVDRLRRRGQLVEDHRGRPGREIDRAPLRLGRPAAARRTHFGGIAWARGRRHVLVQGRGLGGQKAGQARSPESRAQCALSVWEREEVQEVPRAVGVTRRPAPVPTSPAR